MKPTVDQETPESEPEWRPQPELRAEAMMNLLHAGAGTARPGRISLFVHIDLENLGLDTPTLNDLVARNGNAHTEAGIDIDTDSLWNLLSDADVTPVFTMTGTPLSYGRTARLAPPILRRILAHRDKRCRFPGCDHPANKCEIHHIKHWENGGTTDPANSVHLSKGHHHDHHDRGWSIEGDANGPLTVRKPTGELFDAAPAYRQQLAADKKADRQHIRERLVRAQI